MVKYISLIFRKNKIKSKNFELEILGAKNYIIELFPRKKKTHFVNYKKEFVIIKYCH